jgi:hypothetical protein
LITAAIKKGVPNNFVCLAHEALFGRKEKLKAAAEKNIIVVAPG